MLDDNNYFPAECRECYENCFQCTKMRKQYRLADIRHLAAKRMIKQKAIERMQRDLKEIEATLELTKE